jgi:class 3 adenylate cyclase
MMPELAPARPRLKFPQSEMDPDRALVTILISDIVDSTSWVAVLGDRRWRTIIERHDQASRCQIKRFGGLELRNCGDGFVAAFDSPVRAVRCAAAIAKAVAPLGIAIRNGVHTGEVYITGNEFSGIAAHVASRIAMAAQPSETLVSGTVRDLTVGSGLVFEDRGVHLLRGVPERMRLYAMPLASNRSDLPAPAAKHPTPRRGRRPAARPPQNAGEPDDDGFRLLPGGRIVRFPRDAKLG